MNIVQWAGIGILAVVGLVALAGLLAWVCAIRKRKPYTGSRRVRCKSCVN